MKGEAVVFSSGKDNWRTPADLFRKYDELYDFDLDAAADKTNWLVAAYLGPGSSLGEDALVYDWSAVAKTVWQNPPYSMVKEFTAKAAEEAKKGVLTVMLVPARTDTKWFHAHVYNKSNVRIEFVKGRLKFSDENGLGKNSAPFPSMILTFFPVHG
jgi:phage N-6-adenine-methyltransferase